MTNDLLKTKLTLPFAQRRRSAAAATTAAALEQHDFTQIESLEVKYSMIYGI